MLILHVTNGDHAGQALARSGLPGDVLVWRDVLHDGPVPTDDDRPAFWQARARFLAARHVADEQAVVEDLSSRDARLDEMGRGDEVVLWFEPDLFDQLQLMQVLSRLAAREAADRPTVSIAPADLMLGTLSPTNFRPLFDLRRPISGGDLIHGRDAWRAFTDTSPETLLAVVDRFDIEIGARTYAADAAVRLPHLAAALRRVLEEYPDSETGLSRSERQICEALTPGPAPLGKLFRVSHHSSESWAWLGDSSFAWYVQRLSDAAQPLVAHENGTLVLAPTRGADSQRFWERVVMLTDFGRQVVRARADAVQTNGIDRWIGGTRLTSEQHWRWDARMLVPVRSGGDRRTPAARGPASGALHIGPS